jgi:hypothetical protein
VLPAWTGQPAGSVLGRDSAKYKPCTQDEGRVLTNNQWLSLTDQLRLGVRLIELDTHWIDGSLRIGHCGGLKLPPVDAFFEFLNHLAALFGHRVRWDTETLGCSPSLSSIPAGQQRLVASALAEVGAWLQAPENADEFLVVYFDDEHDLREWVRATMFLVCFWPHMMRSTQSASLFSGPAAVSRGGALGGRPVATGATATTSSSFWSACAPFALMLASCSRACVLLCYCDA